MVVQLLIFGDFSGDTVTAFANPKFLKGQDMARFDHMMIFNLAKSLYQIGEELEGGKLKELDLKAYCLITKYTRDQLLIIGVEKNDKNMKKIREIKFMIDDIHEALEKSMVFKDTYKWDKETQIEFLRDRFSSSNVMLSKEIKNLVSF